VFHGGDEIVIEVFPLERVCFLIFLALLGPLTGALILICGRLVFPSFIAEESAHHFFPSSVVCHYVHQLVDGLGTIPV